MNTKTVTEIKKEIDSLHFAIRKSIDEFVKSNPGLELNIEIEKQTLNTTESKIFIYRPIIQAVQ